MRFLLLLTLASSLLAGCSNTCETNADCLPPSVCSGCVSGDDDDSAGSSSSEDEDCVSRRCRTPAEIRGIQNQSLIGR